MQSLNSGRLVKCFRNFSTEMRFSDVDNLQFGFKKAPYVFCAGQSKLSIDV